MIGILWGIILYFGYVNIVIVKLKNVVKYLGKKLEVFIVEIFISFCIIFNFKINLLLCLKCYCV